MSEFPPPSADDRKVWPASHGGRGYYYVSEWGDVRWWHSLSRPLEWAGKATVPLRDALYFDIVRILLDDTQIGRGVVSIPAMKIRRLIEERKGQ